MMSVIILNVPCDTVHGSNCLLLQPPVSNSDVEKFKILPTEMWYLSGVTAALLNSTLKSAFLRSSFALVCTHHVGTHAVWE